MEEEWGEFPEVQQDDPWGDFPEVNAAPEAVESPRVPPEEQAPKSWGQTAVDAVTEVGARMMNPAGALYEMYTGKEDDGITENLAKGITAGVALEAPRNILKTAGSIATYSPIIELYKMATGEEGPELYELGRKSAEEGIAKGLETVIPEFKPEGLSQEVGKTLGEVGTGIVLGNKVQSALKVAGASDAVISSLSQKAPKVAKYLAELTTRSVSQSLGTATAVDEDSATLFVGPNAMIKWGEIGKEEGIPVLEGLGEMSEEEARTQVEKRFSIFLDAMILAGPVDLVADGGRALFGVASESILKPLRATFFDPSGQVKEGVAMERLVFNLRQAIDPKDPGSKVADEYVSKVVEILQNDKDAVMMIPDLKKGGQKAIELDVATAVQRGLREDGSETATSVKEFMDRQRKEVLGSQGGQQTHTASGRTTAALDEILTEGEAIKGGEKGIQQAGRAIQESGETEVSNATAKALQAQAQLDETGSRIGQILSEDEGLGPRLADAAQRPGSGYGVERQKITEEIVEATRAGNKALTDANNLKWDNIPEGLSVDSKSLIRDILDANEVAPLTSPVKRAFKAAGLDIDNVLKGEVPETTADFSKLQNNLRKPLNDAIKASYGKAGYDELINLKRNITEVQPEWLLRQKKAGTSGATRALDEAVTHTREVVGPRAKSGVPQEIRRSDQRAGLNQPKADQDAAKIVSGSISSKEAPMIDHFVDVLSTPEYGAKHGLVVDYALASVADDMSTVLRTDGIIGIDPKNVINSLNRYRTALNSQPEKFAKELKRLDDFEMKLIEASNDAKKLDSLVKEYTKDSKEVRDRLFKSELKEFFTEEGVRKPDAYQSFKEVFMGKQATSSDAPGKVDALIERMNPAAKEGAIAAWLRYGKETFFNPDGTLNTTKSAQALQNQNHYFAIGRKLLGEDQTLVNVVEQLLDPSLSYQVSKKTAAAKSGESMASSAAAKRAATRLVLATKGPLTKTGGRITSAVATILDKLGPDEVNLKIADAIMGDRKEFLRLFNDFANRQAKTKENYRKMFNWLVKSGIYQSDEDFEEWHKAVNNLETEFESSDLFGSAKGAVNSARDFLK